MTEAERIIKIVETAGAFERWRYENGEASSFTVFCEKFGYSQSDAAEIWRETEALLNYVKIRTVKGGEGT